MIGNILCIVRIYVYIDIYTMIKINIIYDGEKNKKIYIVI